MSMNNPNPQTPGQTVIALFANRDDANLGMTRLMNVGVEPGNIGMLEPADAPRHAAGRRSVGVVVGALAGATMGGVVGAFALGLSGLVWTLLAAAIGVTFGSYAGAVFGSFFGGAGSGDEPYFVRAIRDGRILVSAEVADREGETTVVKVLHDSSALEVNSLGTGRLQLEFRHPLEEVA